MNLPTNGATIYVQALDRVIDGTTYLSNDYTYTEFTQSAAAITSPAPGSTLTSASTTFTWNAGSGGATGYYLWVGTSPGSANLVNIGPLYRHQRDRKSAHQRSHNLRAALDSASTARPTSPTTTPTLSSLHSAAAITSPAPGSTLTSASTTFTWNAGSGWSDGLLSLGWHIARQRRIWSTSVR